MNPNHEWPSTAESISVILMMLAAGLGVLWVAGDMLPAMLQTLIGYI